MAIGPREQQLRDMRAAQQKTSKTRPSASAPAKTEGEPVMETAKSPSKKKSSSKPKKKNGGKKEAAAPKAAKAAKASRGDSLRPGSKSGIMLEMAMAPGGATEAQICKKIGWKKCRVTLKRTCEKVGAVLTSKKNEAGETVYSAAMKKAA